MRWRLQVATSFSRKSRHLPDDFVTRRELSPRGGREEMVTGTRMRTGTGMRTRTGTGTRSGIETGEGTGAEMITERRAEESGNLRNSCRGGVEDARESDANE